MALSKIQEFDTKIECDILFPKVMMGNLMHAKNWNLKKRLKLFWIKQAYMADKSCLNIIAEVYWLKLS